MSTDPPPFPPRSPTSPRHGKTDSTSSSIFDNTASTTSVPGTMPEKSDDAVQASTTEPASGDTPVVEPPLTDAELMKLYEDAEIERFLSLFNNYVTGVTAIPTSVSPASTDVPTAPAPIVLPPNTSPIIAFILHRFIPLIPTKPAPFSQSPTEPFTLTMLQANATRLYIFIPEYGKFFNGLAKLAQWEDWGRSARYCAVYWLLWTFDLVLPSIFLLLLFTSLRFHFIPHVSLSDLRERVAAQTEAERFGKAAGMNVGGIGGGIGGTEMLGFRMAWKAWRNSKRTRKVVQGVNAESEVDVLDDGDDEAEDGEGSVDGEVVIKVDTVDDDGTIGSGGSDTDEAPDDAASSVFSPSVFSPSASVTSFDSVATTATTSSIGSSISGLLNREARRAEKERLKAIKRAAKEEAKRLQAEAKEQEKERKAEEKRRAEESKEQEKKRKVDERERKKREKIEEMEKRREEDWRRAVMVALGEMADLHERVKNMFLWRNPAASRVYTCVFAGLSLLTLLLPARYVGKLIYFVAGAAFWFLVPFLSAMPDKDRARMPPPFSDVPTDAQYAFALIKERAARGESLVPNQQNTEQSQAKEGERRVLLEEVTGEAGVEGEGEKPKEKEWEKWVEKGRRTWVWAEEGRRVLSGQPTLAALMAGSSVASFPAQHASSLGTLHITPTSLWFSSLTLSTSPRKIALDEIASVRKLSGIGAGWGVGFAAVMGGAKWGGMEVVVKRAAVAAEDGVEGEAKEAKEEEEEIVKFPFVGKRDEAFALLLAYSGQEWLRT